jgi:hypothetical protein
VVAGVIPSHTIHVCFFRNPRRIRLLRFFSVGHGLAHWSVFLVRNQELASSMSLVTASWFLCEASARSIRIVAVVIVPSMV